MADLLLAERLQPSLLDRLTDEAPGRDIDSEAEQFIDINRLRKIIHRDLTWLLNCSNIEAMHDLDLFPNTAASVVNFGISNLSGTGNTQGRIASIQQTIRKAIEVFEPRILRETIEVTPFRKKTDSDAVIAFDIRGELWAKPVPVDLYLRTALDVTNGDLTIKQV
ncbi:type VI secretion system protein ImpF [Cohaesibacter marisflavi]|uniref:Type VI secretion system protein ImpF n=1 Tax=Cohaesibacter marisflavi TaxID=655353 RepID=A0A1I5KJ71_9HYPH|nr:type VI secretion system baseplate subunit TssE [Cohaesibacter marisflavi]SFO84611.1 type VI secretion system protein ImpF [Cohaesibacter marisflavi]